MNVYISKFIYFFMVDCMKIHEHLNSQIYIIQARMYPITAMTKSAAYPTAATNTSTAATIFLAAQSSATKMGITCRKQNIAIKKFRIGSKMVLCSAIWLRT